MRKSLPVIASVLCLAAATPAQAVDFVFNVPVRIENMRNVTRAFVSCTAGQTVSGIPHPLGPSSMVDVPLVDGSFHGTIPVNFSVSSGYAASDATDWQCALTYLWRMPDGSTFSRSLTSSEDRGALYTRYTGQEVASAHTDESGPVSH